MHMHPKPEILLSTALTAASLKVRPGRTLEVAAEHQREQNLGLALSGSLLSERVRSMVDNIRRCRSMKVNEACFTRAKVC